MPKQSARSSKQRANDTDRRRKVKVEVRFAVYSGIASRFSFPAPSTCPFSFDLI